MGWENSNENRLHVMSQQSDMLGRSANCDAVWKVTGNNGCSYALKEMTIQDDSISQRIQLAEREVRTHKKVKDSQFICDFEDTWCYYKGSIMNFDTWKREHLEDYKKESRDKLKVYILLELCRTTLAGLLKDTVNPISERKARFYIASLIEALRFMHAKNIWHRDI